MYVSVNDSKKVWHVTPLTAVVSQSSVANVRELESLSRMRVVLTDVMTSVITGVDEIIYLKD